ncbi:hypothetical protein AKJ16_DCAP10437 [Drosera capensis]
MYARVYVPGLTNIGSEMKSSYIFLCFVVSALLFLCFYDTLNHTSLHSLSSSSRTLRGQMPRRVLLAYLESNIETPKPKEQDEDMHDSKHREGYSEVEYQTSERGDEWIYHVDYHGVMTHPNPAPKHPAKMKDMSPLKSNAPPAI